MPVLNLRDSDKNSICKIAGKSFSQSVEIWAYGSRVDGKSHSASDLDIVIRSKDLKPIKAHDLAEFKEQLQNSNIPILIQTFDWACLPESFQKNILKNYVILFSNIE